MFIIYLFLLCNKSSTISTFVAYIKLSFTKEFNSALPRIELGIKPLHSSSGWLAKEIFFAWLTWWLWVRASAPSQIDRLWLWWDSVVTRWAGAPDRPGHPSLPATPLLPLGRRGYGRLSILSFLSFFSTWDMDPPPCGRSLKTDGRWQSSFFNVYIFSFSISGLWQSEQK